MSVKLTKILNELRNLLIFRICYPWIKKGKNVHCQIGTRFWSPHKDITLGNNVGIGFNCFFMTDVNIGDDVMIASCCAFINSDDHIYTHVGKTMWESGRGDNYKIVVEDDVWIGHGAILVAPVIVGHGSIVAAGSVVTRDVQPYAIVAGVPARVLKMRFSSTEIEEHERILSVNKYKNNQ